MNDKLKKIMIIVIAIFIVLFLFLFLLSRCSRTFTPENLELEIVKKAKIYYKNHKDDLPGESVTKTLSLGDLTTLGIIEELDKMLDKGTTCSGSLTIENNNNYIMYSPILNCTSNNENYQSILLKDKLKENIVTTGDGLYNINGSYYFRGENVDNYLVLDGILWRIMKINDDGTIKLIENDKRSSVVWDDRYNDEMSNMVGINNYFYNNLNSRIKENLDEIYNGNEIFTDDGKGYIKKTSLCIGKRSKEDTSKDGSTECSERLDNQYIGLIQLNEYLIASLDQNCTDTMSNSCSNYNYLSKLKGNYWTITAFNGNTHYIYKIGTRVTTSSAINTAMARIVINISENTSVHGSGTEEDPYVVTGFEKKI